MITLRTVIEYLVKCTMEDQLKEKSELCFALNRVSELAKLLIDTLGRTAILKTGMS